MSSRSPSPSRTACSHAGPPNSATSRPAITYRRSGEQGQRVLANGGYAVPVAQ